MEQPSNQTLADIELLHETGNATADSGHPSEETGASSELSDCYEVLQVCRRITATVSRIR